MTGALEVLRTLAEAFGPSGYEDEVRDAIASLVRPVVDEMRVDALGNLIVTRRGRSSDVVMLDAHMDEVGFLASYVDADGFVRLAQLGGWDARILPSHSVLLRTAAGDKLRGVIGALPPHVLRQDERSKGHTLEELFVDFGAASRAELHEMGAAVGDPIVPGYGFEHLTADVVACKAFDDRAGCTVLVQALHALADTEPEMTVVGAFTIGEETGLRGAKTAAFQVRPRVLLALEGTTAANVPGVAAMRAPSAMGAGAAITIQDASIVVHPKVHRLLREIAVRDAIPHQVKLPGAAGGNDAGAAHQVAEGSVAGVLSVPCRYIHSPWSMLRLSDLDATIRLATAFALDAGRVLADG